MEIWKKVIGFENLYEVSSEGRVRSTYKNGKTKILKQEKTYNGYLRVWLCKKGQKKRKYFVHRVVASAFIPNPSHYPQVNHKDYDKTNNKVENLEWLTQKANSLYSAENARKSALNSRTPASGHHYIYKKGNRFIFSIIVKGKYIGKAFQIIDEAIAYRDSYMLKSYEI